MSWGYQDRLCNIRVIIDQWYLRRSTGVSTEGRRRICKHHQHSCSTIIRSLWLTPGSKGTFSWVTSDQMLLGRRVEMISAAAAPCSALQQPPVKGQCVCTCVVPHRGWWERRRGGGRFLFPDCTNVLAPLTLDKSILKSSLKSFRLKLLFQRSMQRQHIKPCVSAHSRQETITNSIVLKSPSHYGRLQSSICSQAEVRTQDSARETSAWHPCREMLSPNEPKVIKSHDLWGNRIAFNPPVKLERARVLLKATQWWFTGRDVGKVMLILPIH